MVTIIEGRYYKTRDGRKVGPAKKRSRDEDRWAVDNGHPWQCGTGFMHYPDGRCAYKWANGLDLIAEWQDGPVVTETVKRIVPGVYGRLAVAGDAAYSSGKVAVVRFVNRGTAATHGTPTYGLDLEELRAAAAVLTQLADALESK